MEVIRFNVDTPLEVYDEEKRIVGGRIVPFGKEIEHKGRKVSFNRGAFADIAINAKLLRSHDQRNPIGKMVELEEREDGAYAKFHISKTTAGDEALALAADGVLDQFSVGVLPGEKDKSGAHIKVAGLPEVSLTAFGAFGAEAQVIEVHEDAPKMENENTITEAQLEDVKTLIADVQTAMEERFERLQATVGNETKPKNMEALGDLYLDSLMEKVSNSSHEKRDKFETELGEIETYANLAAVDGKWNEENNVGPLVQQSLFAQLTTNTQHQLERPMFGALSQDIPFAEYVRFPVVSQGASAGARAGQNQDVNTREIQFTMATFTAQDLDSGAAIPYELIRLASTNPELTGFVRNELRTAYAAAVESQIVTYWNANDFGGASTAGTADAVLFAKGMYHVAESGITELRATSAQKGQEQVSLLGAVIFLPQTGLAAAQLDLDTSTYAVLVEQIATANVTIKSGSGRRADTLVCADSIWPKVISSAANQYAGLRVTVGSEISPTAESFELMPGLTAVHVPGLAL